MILADKIIKLRKQLGWSQEELAEKLEVSRQSVSKWESTQSIPDLNKIIKLAEIFSVSTDFLLLDERETTEFVDSDKDTSINQVSLEQGLRYINVKLDSARLKVKGISLCVCSPTPLLFLLALINSGQVNLSTKMAITLGIVGLLLMVSFSIRFFIRTDQYKTDITAIEHEKFELAYGVHSVFMEKRQSFLPTYNRRLSLGVGLFIIGSVIPFLAAAILSDRADMVLLMLALMFVMIAIGLFFVVPVSTQLDAYNFLLNEGDRDAGKTEQTKNAESIAAFYWPLLLTIYLGWSLWTMNWGVTWIVFPVGAVAFAALVGLMGLLKKSDNP